MPGGLSNGRFDWWIDPGVCKTRREKNGCVFRIMNGMYDAREKKKRRANDCSYMNEGVDARSEEL